MKLGKKCSYWIFQNSCRICKLHITPTFQSQIINSSGLSQYQSFKFEQIIGALSADTRFTLQLKVWNGTSRVKILCQKREIASELSLVEGELIQRVKTIDSDDQIGHSGADLKIFCSRIYIESHEICHFFHSKKSNNPSQSHPKGFNQMVIALMSKRNQVTHSMAYHQPQTNIKAKFGRSNGSNLKSQSNESVRNVMKCKDLTISEPFGGINCRRRKEKCPLFSEKEYILQHLNDALGCRLNLNGRNTPKSTGIQYKNTSNISFSLTIVVNNLIKMLLNKQMIIQLFKVFESTNAYQALQKDIFDSKRTFLMLLFDSK